MITLKAIQTSLVNTNHAFFTISRLPHTKNNPLLITLCKSSNSNSNSNPNSEAYPQPGGDTRRQDILARIAMIQAKKVRLTDYLDERSAHLTQFAEEATAELDKIGEDALKDLDEASARIMENIESRMQEFEESAETNRLEIEKNENELAAFEGQIEKDMNEGLFFKNLGQKSPKQKTEATDEMKKIKELTIERAGSKTRRNIYLALIGLVVTAIADSFFSSSADWRKVAVLGAILVGLLTQFAYEQQISSSETEKIEKIKKEEEKM